MESLSSMISNALSIKAGIFYSIESKLTFSSPRDVKTSEKDSSDKTKLNKLLS